MRSYAATEGKQPRGKSSLAIFLARLRLAIAAVMFLAIAGAMPATAQQLAPDGKRREPADAHAGGAAHRGLYRYSRHQSARARTARGADMGSLSRGDAALVWRDCHSWHDRGFDRRLPDCRPAADFSRP